MDLNSVNITATQVAKNYFSAYVENGFIYSYSVYGERQQVGVTNDAYTALQKTAQEALDKAEKYYQRLVELGDIVPPKTSEETIAELMSVVSELRNEIREMKTVQHKGDSNESIKYTDRTQYMIENTAKQTQEQAMALANALGTKIDFYEYQNLRDQLAQERTKNVVLENRVYSDAKFNALERQNEAMFGVLKSEIADLSCNVPKRPPYYAQGFVACGSPIPNGCCN